MQVIIDWQLEAFTACGLAYTEADIVSAFNQSSISFSKICFTYYMHKQLSHVVKDYRCFI
jgi:hypothetical protein